MMTFQELRIALQGELIYCLNNNIIDETLKYFNETTRDTSAYLTAILQEHLLLDDDYNWDPQKWLDDILLTKIRITERRKVSIWGVAIWGREDTTEQWTEPLYFEAEINKRDKELNKYLFLFGDLNYSEITYEEFSINRDCWDRDFYSNTDWDSLERKWYYTIKVG